MFALEPKSSEVFPGNPARLVLLLVIPLPRREHSSVGNGGEAGVRLGKELISEDRI